MERFITAVSKTVWGTPMLILLVGSGVYLTLRLRFFQATRIKKWVRATFGEIFKKREREIGISPYQAVSSALASSIGTGNIVGVATAITAGGAGAVFWMWVSAFFGMATKYAEIFLAVKFRERRGGEYTGGPMHYIRKGLPSVYAPLAVVFALSGSFACIGMGAMNQSNAISSVLNTGAGVPIYISGAITAIIAVITLGGGITRISAFAERAVPIMAGIYVFGGVLVFFASPGGVWQAICKIMTSALAPNAVYGGAAGEMMRRALRYGVARGVFSNEAGLGSAPLVHAAADAKGPLEQGFWGVFEVFVDTIVVCTVTAVVIISSGCDASKVTGAELVSSAFEKHLGLLGNVFVSTATILFALSTILCWSYYGERCFSYLTRENASAKKVYRALYVSAVFIGACMRVESVWEIADMFNGIMIIPNIIAVILLSDVVVRETNKKLFPK